MSLAYRNGMEHINWSCHYSLLSSHHQRLRDRCLSIPALHDRQLSHTNKKDLSGAFYSSAFFGREDSRNARQSSFDVTNAI